MCRGATCQVQYFILHWGSFYSYIGAGQEILKTTQNKLHYLHVHITNDKNKSMYSQSKIVAVSIIIVFFKYICIRCGFFIQGLCL